jgi:glycosyltransferase involved in cell wall biosynthesis
MKISVCMIVRNEERFIEKCLNSIKELADEIVIVDTSYRQDKRDSRKIY